MRQIRNPHARTDTAGARYTDRLGRVLCAVGVIEGRQWQEAIRSARGTTDWAAPLAALCRLRAAWAPPDDPTPGLTPYQHDAIVAHVRRGQIDRLPRALRRNGYLILQRLGRGGMGVVYQGWDLARCRHVALKMVRHHDAEHHRRFRREARLLARLDHPAIPRFFSLEKANGIDLLVMEYVRGQTAHQHVVKLRQQGQQLPWPQALAWALQALDALEHLHRQGVIHRDVKPANLMVTADETDTLKLIDFGLAKSKSEWEKAALSATDQVLGTHEYMAPEQWASARRAGPEADLYALGGVLFFLLTGQPPFRTETLAEAWLAHSRAPRPSVRRLRPDVPAAVDNLVQRLLAVAPGQRGSASELNGRFNSILRDASGPHPMQGEPTAKAVSQAPLRQSNAATTAGLPVPTRSLTAPDRPQRRRAARGALAGLAIRPSGRISGFASHSAAQASPLFRDLLARLGRPLLGPLLAGLFLAALLKARGFW